MNLLPATLPSTTLLLNSTYEPLQVISWQRAVTMLWLGKVEVVRTYKGVLRAVSWTIRQPAVVRLVNFVRRHRVRIGFSRRNVFVRDGFTCQYCGVRLPVGELTCDHVTPRSVGGESNWDNLVAACGPCNYRKGNRTPEQARMHLRRKPSRPDALSPARIGVGASNAPEQWREFLAWFEAA
jgi:5-methylcytosine-specific restriction endonuclease McrA